MPSLRDQGRGPANAKALLRLFDAPDGTVPRVTLYRDHAGWCPYCVSCFLPSLHRVTSNTMPPFSSCSYMLAFPGHHRRRFGCCWRRSASLIRLRRST